jgi:hypothetical protein
MVRRPILLALLTNTALVLGVGGGLAPPAQADPAPTVSTSFSAATVHPGDTFTMDVTFTNPEAVPVTFSYLSVSPTFATWFGDGMKYRITGCTGQAWSCWLSNPDPPMGAYMQPVHPAGAPLGPGQSRTQTITIQVDATSPCEGRRITFYLYSYRESAAGNVSETFGGLGGLDAPGLVVDC